MTESRRGHAPDCTDTGPHFISPSFGQVGFFGCNPPADLRNHTRCRPPFDHDHEDHHALDPFAAPEENARRQREREPRLEDLAVEVATRLANENHRHLCMCDYWPTSCASGYSFSSFVLDEQTHAEATLRVLIDLGRLT